MTVWLDYMFCVTDFNLSDIDFMHGHIYTSFQTASKGWLYNSSSKQHLYEINTDLKHNLDKQV